MSYDPSIGAPNWGPVNTHSRDAARDLPKNYSEAREAFEHASKRRGKAAGMVARNTSIEKLSYSHSIGSYAIVFHETKVVTFHPDCSVTLNSGGWQTFATRDRINRCGFRLSMSGGIPSLPWGGLDVPFRDGMILNPDGTVGGTPVCGSVAEITSRRRRVLARARRNPGFRYCPFYWPLRSGGQTTYRGTVPEAFRTDSELGLKPRTRKGI